MTEFREKDAETWKSHFTVIAIMLINIAIFVMMASEYHDLSFNSEQALDWGRNGITILIADSFGEFSLQIMFTSPSRT